MNREKDMKKSLTENISNCAENQQVKIVRQNKVAFLALKNEISEALEKGWSYTAIWETLFDEGSFTASYNTFRLYIVKYLNGQKPGYSFKDSLTYRNKKAAVNHTVIKKPASMPGFTYNPNPKIEDLI